MDQATLLVALIVFAAAYLQSSTGFGLALVGMALIPLILPVTEAIAFVSASSLLVTISIMLANRSGLSLRLAAPLCLGMCAGIPLGYFLLHSMEGGLLVRILGIVLMAVAVAELAKKRFTRLALPDRSGGPLGLFGGILAGAFNVGGPPVVAYVFSRDWGKVQMVAILQSVFVAGGVTRNLLMVGSGEYTADLARMVAVAVPPALFAVWLGKRTLDRLPLTTLRRVVFLLVFVIGLHYALSG